MYHICGAAFAQFFSVHSVNSVIMCMLSFCPFCQLHKLSLVARGVLEQRLLIFFLVSRDVLEQPLLSFFLLILSFSLFFTCRQGRIGAAFA